MSVLVEISENLQKGRAKLVSELVQKALDEKIEAKTILEDALLSGMNIIGDKFKKNEVFVPEVLIASRAMNMGVSVLRPYLIQEGVKPVGKVALGTVKGDHHDIGKNLVKMMFEGKGLEVVDLGIDVPAEKFVQFAIDNEDCKVIACSALLTTTMGVMKEVVEKAKEMGIRDKVKIMIGGAPVTQNFCDNIGADAYAVDAATGAEMAASFYA